MKYQLILQCRDKEQRLLPEVDADTFDELMAVVLRIAIENNVPVWQIRSIDSRTIDLGQKADRRLFDPDLLQPHDPANTASAAPRGGVSGHGAP